MKIGEKSDQSNRVSSPYFKLDAADQVWGRRIYIAKAKSVYTRAYWLILESEVWLALEIIAKKKKMTIDMLIQIIHDKYKSKFSPKLADAARRFVANQYIEDFGDRPKIKKIMAGLNSGLGELDNQGKPSIFQIVSDE